MRPIILLSFSFVFHFVSVAQNTVNTRQVDTLEVFAEKTLAHINVYNKDKLSLSADAFIYRTTEVVQRSIIPLHLYRREIAVDSIVYHGRVKRIFDGIGYSIGEYTDGEKQYVEYFDEDGNESTVEELLGRSYTDHFERGHGFFWMSSKRLGD